MLEIFVEIVILVSAHAVVVNIEGGEWGKAGWMENWTAKLSGLNY
jgi:hypothetical protein